MERVIAILVEVAQATKLCANPVCLCVCWSFQLPKTFQFAISTYAQLEGLFLAYNSCNQQYWMDLGYFIETPLCCSSFLKGFRTQD
jgi:hypothetical protein